MIDCYLLTAVVPHEDENLLMRNRSCIGTDCALIFRNVGAGVRRAPEHIEAAG